MKERDLAVLIVGSGAREHALYRAIRASPRVARTCVAPGNGGIPSGDRRAVSDLDIEGLVALARREAVDVVVIGPEAPLVAGLADRLAEAGIAAFGPSAGAARLEGSKAFAKDLCADLGVPTAEHRIAATMAEAEAAIAAFGAPVVIKADGLCAGKGVTVAASAAEAREAARLALVEKVFGAAGERLVVERCLTGPECSVMAIADGESAVLLPAVRDHKRALDGDRGPNTGGMGAYAPLPDVDDALLGRIDATIVRPVLRGMAARGTPFRGVLYAGLMLTPAGPQVIEFNCRFGDPETQVALPLLKTDVVDLMLASLTPGGLARMQGVARPGTAVCVVLASGGYPGAYPTGKPITGVAEAERDALVFHAGTRNEDGTLLTAGGRVLSVVGLGETREAARRKAYAAAARIDFAGRQMRADIAADPPGS